jgi:hypothetical protein
VIIYLTAVIIGLLILFARFFIGDAKFWTQLLLKLLPVICVIIAKFLITKIAAEYVFLNKKSSILAIDNFRYN